VTLLASHEAGGRRESAWFWRHFHVAARRISRALTKMSAVNPLTSLLGGGAGGKSDASKKGFRDILLFAVSKLRGELLSRPGDTARLRKGLLEDRLTDRVWVSRAAVFGEGRRASAGFKKCQCLWRRWARQAESSAAEVWADGVVVRCERQAWLGGSGKSETGAALALGIFTRECAGAVQVDIDQR
jgi:hypothetical protein